MYIDSHTHISKKYYDDIDLVINNAYDAGVKYLILSCCELDEIKEGIELSKKYNNIFLAIGLHPSEVNKYSKDDLIYIMDIAKREKKVVAIGEIGLDYHYGSDNKEKQKELFEQQMLIAQELNLPVIIHTREATNDTLNVLKRFKNRGVIHCFNGSKETLKEYIKIGYKIGIGGVITFKNTNLQNTILSTNLDNIILETDSPFLTPEPYRGKKNESKYIPIISKKVAEIFKVSDKYVEEKTSKNVLELFDLNRLL